MYGRAPLSRKRLSKQKALARGLLIGAIFASFSAGTAWAADGIDATTENDNGFITLQTENDKYAFNPTDRHYTNGVQASWLSGPRDDMPEWLKDIAAPPLLADPSSISTTTHRVGVSLAQAIFTPEDTQASYPIYGDRPYAAWTHLTFSLLSVRTTTHNSAWQDRWNLDVGMVGPHAYGEQVQNGFHDMIDVETAKGWDHQIHDEPGLNLTFERAWRSSLFDTPQLLGMDTDFIPYGVAALGNVSTLAGLGGTFRIGPNLPDDFGPTRIYPGIGGSEWFHTSKTISWYFFGGVEGRAVARDIFLDGNTFRDSQHVSKKPLTGDLRAGLVVVLGRARLSFTQVLRSEEFYGQVGPDQFGSLTLSLAL